MSVAPEDVKACCAPLYGSAAARWLLGESFHPGGPALTSRLIAALAVGRGARIVDVGSGPGASALQAARETGCAVVGIDLAPECVVAAREAAVATGLADRVRFVTGDAEDLPFPDESFDGALCECSLCIFPDKPKAAAELARVLRPGARLALSDVTAEQAALPPGLQTVAAWVACLADAKPLTATSALLEEAGLAVEVTESQDGALMELLDRVDARLRPLELGLDLLDAARSAVDRGLLGYGIVVARRRGNGKPTPEATPPIRRAGGNWRPADASAELLGRSSVERTRFDAPNLRIDASNST
jgi:arsenite methyltransferase